MDKTKVCTKCGIEYPATKEYFNVARVCSDGLRPDCKLCCRKWRQENKEVLYAKQKEWYDKNKNLMVERYAEHQKSLPNDATKVCCRCKKELPLTVDYFHRTKYSKNGFKSICKKCDGGHYGVAFPNAVYESKDGYQYCSKCRKELPISKEYFIPDKRRSTGFGSICKVCNGVSSYGFHKKIIPKSIKEGYKYCSKCLRELPETPEYFYADRGKFRSICKECNGQLFGETKLNPHIKDVAKDGYYICRHCKKELPLNSDYFGIYSSYKTGYNCYCKECQREKENKWIDKNLERHRARAVIKSQRRRNLKRKLPSTFTQEQWNECKEYFDQKCAYCGKELPLFQDHFMPLSKGGEYTHNNIIPACDSCNSRKFNHDPFTWYPKQDFYSKQRGQKILKYLGYNKFSQQQLTLF